MNVVNEMQVSCSNCNANYSVNTTQLKKLDSSVLTCKKCKKFIKITFCPSCGAFYSISFKSVENRYYTMRCRKCHTTFTVDFPFSQNESQPEKRTSSTHDEKRKKKPVAGRTGKSLFNQYNLRELLAVSASAFSLPGITAASVGVIAALLIFFLSEIFQSALLGAYIGPEQTALRSFLNLFPLSLVFFVFILTSALISRMTLERIFYNRGLGVVTLLRFISRTWLPVFMSNIFILLVVNTVITLFGNIPGVGPIIFSLLFLPLYLISILMVITLFFGFWFYPPIIAYRNTGILSNIKNFFTFLKKQNMALLFVVPILMMITSIAFAALSLLHTGALSLSLLITDGAGGEPVSGLLASIPPGLLRISELTFFGNEMGRFKDLVSGLVFSQHAGGLFVGIVLASLSVLLAASFISLVSTLSTHVYILMERGVDVDDRKKLRLLGILVLLLAGIVLVKKLIS